jgi:hypothetical protein
MKQNITLSIDKNLIRKAKIMAAQKQTSISRMLSRELEKMVQKAERYEWAEKRAVANLGKGFHLGGKKMVSREELHERR